jgi:hypothetical protein
MWNISTTWTAWTHNESVHVKLNPWLPWQKQHTTRRRILYQQIGLRFKEETSAVLHLVHSCVWCWNLDTSESRSEVPGKFWNVVLEKDWKIIWADRVSNKELLHRGMEKRKILHTVHRSKANCISRTLRRNFLIKHATEVNIERRIEVTEGRGRRRK